MRTGQKEEKGIETYENDNRWMKIHPPQHSPMSDTKLSFLNTQVCRVWNKVLSSKEGQTQVYLQ